MTAHPQSRSTTRGAPLAARSAARRVTAYSKRSSWTRTQHDLGGPILSLRREALCSSANFGGLLVLAPRAPASLRARRSRDAAIREWPRARGSLDSAARCAGCAAAGHEPELGARGPASQLEIRCRSRLTKYAAEGSVAARRDAAPSTIPGGQRRGPCESREDSAKAKGRTRGPRSRAALARSLFIDQDCCAATPAGYLP